MNKIENESSDEEDGSITQTNVLLGYSIPKPDEEEFSKIGGYPVAAFHNLNSMSFVILRYSKP